MQGEALHRPRFRFQPGEGRTEPEDRGDGALLVVFPVFLVLVVLVGVGGIVDGAFFLFLLYVVSLVLGVSGAGDAVTNVTVGVAHVLAPVLGVYLVYHFGTRLCCR